MNVYGFYRLLYSHGPPVPLLTLGVMANYPSLCGSQALESRGPFSLFKRTNLLECRLGLTES